MNIALFVWTVMASCSGAQCDPPSGWKVLTMHSDPTGCLATAASLQIPETNYRCVALSNGFVYTPTGGHPSPYPPQ